MKRPLLSRGSLIELTPRNWIADGRDAWACDGCGTVYFEDREDMLLDHPTKKGDMLCCQCAKNWLNDNPISPEPLNIGQANHDAKPFVVMAGTGLLQ